MARAESVALPLELHSLLTGLSAAEVADDQQWILRLMRKQGLVVIALLWRMLESEQDALDAYQTAICRLSARGAQGIGANPAGYFYRTAVNAGIEILRARQRQRQNWPAVIDAQSRQRAANAPHAGVIDQREAVERMREAICKLPPHLRNVVVLRDLAELPYSQVAGILGITPGTARLYRRQAVVRLADLIGREAEP